MKDWKCQECGYEFNKTVPRSGEMTCPKCHSTDIDVAVNSKHNIMPENKADKIKRGNERYGSKKENEKPEEPAKKEE